MGQVLSEGEVDALLKGVGEGEVQTETDQVDEVTGVTPYDLTSQEKIISTDYKMSTNNYFTEVLLNYKLSKVCILHMTNH